MKYLSLVSGATILLTNMANASTTTMPETEIDQKSESFRQPPNAESQQQEYANDQQHRILPGRRDRPILKDKPARKQSQTILENLHFQHPTCERREETISPPVPGSGRRASQDRAFAIGGAKVEDEKRRASVVEMSKEEMEERGKDDIEGEEKETLYRCRDW